MKTNKLTAEEMVIADRLRQMKMSGMAEAYEEQLLNPNSDLISFQDRFAAIINFEWELRFNKKFNRFLKKATLRYPQASFDETIYEPDRMLDTETIEQLATCKWLDEGRNLLITGATGAGKTTITNLINRFYDIKEGTITFDGINVKDIKKSDLRKSLGLVLQDTNLFTGTILENIKYGKDDATMDEVIEACKLANADSFIKRLPDGYNTMITNNGANLSQGQRQLLSIARCALINPPVMILDEATSSIDTRTEKIVQDGMDKLMNNRTVFVIAHRLSTVQNSKAIIVLDHGKIIERGSHDELLEQKGTYYQLYTGKFELE